MTRRQHLDRAAGATMLLALFALTDRQRYVFVQRAIRGRTLADIATELGVTEQAICKTEKFAVKRLRMRLSVSRELLAA